MHDDYIVNAGMKNVSKLASCHAVVVTTILDMLS